ncbi:MAG: hypothetical protein EX271_09940 [Acidimicrobiales bacterium]|nr:hypothetical protein [Hyphomonadaceae bacterium]RZV40617.1 MAG: hypothetical protein EX271_09940 [Acidimicrobiales bacterium]
MASFFARFNGRNEAVAVAAPRDVSLELSGPALASALQALLSSCEEDGGIERYVEALKFKSGLFRDAFKNRGEDLTADNFTKLCMFMPTVRRRIGEYVEDDAYPALQAAFKGLFAPGDVNARIVAFESKFPTGKKFRWVRDLAAEILHNTDPELYPIMTRWVWDLKANSGVIREIWHGDNVDNIRLDVPDEYETFIKLREDLSGYLTQNGVFTDVLHYVDLLCAQVYAGYIASQGGTFLKADFAAKQDPIIFTRRLLGLDGVQAKSNRKIPASVIDGEARSVESIMRLNGSS